MRSDEPRNTRSQENATKLAQTVFPMRLLTPWRSSWLATDHGPGSTTLAIARFRAQLPQRGPDHANQLLTEVLADIP